MADNFDRFTAGARNVFSLAQEEAQRFNHNYLGTEHLLLGLVREGDGIAARVLANLGVELSKLRSSLLFIIGRGDGLVVGDPGLTPRAKKVIELAMDEGRRLNNHEIGTEHLLLGLIREGEGIAAGMLESLGVSLERVRQAVLQAAAGASTAVDAAREQEMSARRLWKMLLGLPDEEFERLASLADELGRPLAELIRDTIRRTWLANGGNAGTPTPA